MKAETDRHLGKLLWLTSHCTVLLTSNFCIRVLSLFTESFEEIMCEGGKNYLWQWCYNGSGADSPLGTVAAAG